MNITQPRALAVMFAEVSQILIVNDFQYMHIKLSDGQASDAAVVYTIL